MNTPNPQKYLTGFRQIFFVLKQTVKIIWEIKPKLLLLVIIINIIAGFLTLPGYFIDKLVLDTIVANIGNPFWQEALKILSLLFLFRLMLSLVRSVIRYIVRYIQENLSMLFSRQVDFLICQKIAELDLETIDNPQFRDRFQKIDRHSGRRIWSLASILISLPSDITTLISTLSILFIFNPFIALVVMIVSIPNFLVDARYSKADFNLETVNGSKYRMWGQLYRWLTNVRDFTELKIIGVSDFLLNKLQLVQEDIMNQRMSVIRQKYWGRFVAFWPENLMVFGISLYLGYLAIIKTISIGSAQMYLRAINSLQSDLNVLLDSFVQIYSNYLFVSDLVWLINLKPILPNGSLKLPAKLKTGIEFRHIWFKYQDDAEWILRDVNLIIPAKENLAIVGENGAGKTTLVRLLCRFYDPTKGEILIDGKNVKEYDRKDLWHHFAVLFQNFSNYGFNAREAIGYGRVSEVENLPLITNAAKKALIHEYIESLPLKYETPFDPEFEKGVRLSGGQLQRVALARVLLRNSQVMIMDEPTSNLDPKAEEEIFKTLLIEAKQKNLILISHRFSTVRLSDKICVMDKGKITEYGSHEELMEKKGMYAELFNLQAKSYQ